MDVRSVINLAHDLESKSEFEGALAAYRSVLKQVPDNFRALMGAGRNARKSDDLTVATEYFRRAGSVRPGSPQPLIQLGVTEALYDLPAALRTYAAGQSRFPDNERLKVLEATARIRLGFDDSAFDLDAELENPTYAEAVYLAVLADRKATHTEAQSAQYYGKLAEIFQRDSSKLNHATALVEQRDYIGALEVFNSISNETSSRLMMGRTVCTSALGDLKGAERQLEQCMAGDLSDHMTLTTCAAFLDASPDLAAAVRTISNLNRRYSDPGLGNLLEFVRQIRSPKRALLKGNIRDSDFRLSEPGHTGAAVLAFAGFGMKTGALPFSLIDRFFAGHGVAAGSLFDRRGCLFWKGVPAFGETLDASVNGLKDRLGAMGVSRTYTLGNSGGGVGAMVYGCELEAQRALSFSGPTDLRPSFLRQHGDTRGQAVIHALKRRLDDNQLNLRGWLEDRELRCPIHAYFCEKENQDAVQAKNIAHLPEVSLHPVDYYSKHECIGSALGTGDLLREFNNIIEEIHNE